MKKITQSLICFLLCLVFVNQVSAQKTDSAKQAKDNSPHTYFIINAGTTVNAFFNDKPVQASTMDEFNAYILANVKSLRESWVIVTGKPKTGTFDEIMKTLKRNRFKHISTNIKE